MYAVEVSNSAAQVSTLLKTGLIFNLLLFARMSFSDLPVKSAILLSEKPIFLASRNKSLEEKNFLDLMIFS